MAEEQTPGFFRIYGLRVAGIAAGAALSGTLMIQILMMRQAAGASSIPTYFFDIVQIFTIAVFLLAAGCIMRSMSGAGVVFTAFQIFLLSSLISGLPPVPVIVLFLVFSLIFLEITQTLAFRTDACEPNLPSQQARESKDDVDAYVATLESVFPGARQHLAVGKALRLRPAMSRVAAVWIAVAVSLIAAVFLMNNNPMLYILVLFLVLFPLSVISLSLLKRFPTTEKEVEG